MSKLNFKTIIMILIALFMFNTSIVFGQEKIKILSYNVLYGLQKDSLKNRERYQQLLIDLSPDIVATQEMNEWKQKTLEQLAISYGHPYALQSKEDGFPVALTSKFPFSKFQKVTENMWHSYIYAKVKGIHIFVIHLSPHNLAKRLEEVQAILAHANDLPQKEPILIMGDFNSLSADDSVYYGIDKLESMKAQEKKHNHIRNLNNGKIDYTVLGNFKSAGYMDSFKVLNFDFESSVPTLKSGEAKIKTTKAMAGSRIDYILINKAAQKILLKSAIIKNDQTDIISDHYPTYVELKIR